MDLLLDKKKRIMKNGEEILDLTSKVYDMDKAIIVGMFMLPVDEEGRIDKTAFNHISQSKDAIDTLMYVNKIYNPFSLEANEPIYNCNFVAGDYTTPKEITLPDGSSSSPSQDSHMDEKTFLKKTEEATEKLQSKPDLNRKMRLAKLAASRNNGLKEIKPANELDSNKSSKEYKISKIILGTAL